MVDFQKSNCNCGAPARATEERQYDAVQWETQGIKSYVLLA
jgi:hypothetical protein